MSLVDHQAYREPLEHQSVSEGPAPAVSWTSWTRRSWLTRNAVAFLVVTHHRTLGWPTTGEHLARRTTRPEPRTAARSMAQVAAQAERLDLPPWQALAQRAVEAAQRAGAQYADVRLTRTIHHRYGFDVPAIPFYTSELVGCGVRALVNGYWGFAACPTGDVLAPADAVVQLAQGAVAQARANANGGTPRAVDMGRYPAATGNWATPVTIDPFTISIEEKGSYIAYWMAWARQQGINIDPIYCSLVFTREERVVATSDGTLVTQTRYESGGTIGCKSAATGGNLMLNLTGLKPIGKGWELFATDAKIPEQLAGMRERLEARAALGGRPAAVGRYTLVCDGATMAALVGATLGLATQLDRALGYEANAGGTSFLDDPLAMVGQYQIAAPFVTVTANRSAPAQLATVKWDDEGVEPQPFALVKDGALVDFQTTREQAAWLAPYYEKTGKPVRSHGCAMSADALGIPLQQQPNLALAPNPQAVGVDDLVANVKDGILITDGAVLQVDFQARTGLLQAGSDGNGMLRKITNGRVGPRLLGGAVFFDTLDLFKHIVALGGAQTTAVVSQTPYTLSLADLLSSHWKGEPSQLTSYSAQGVAATIASQPIIDPDRKV